jgi:hypothetical protein
MAEIAAWLVDRAIPRVPVRQWVLSAKGTHTFFLLLVRYPGQTQFRVASRLTGTGRKYAFVEFRSGHS